MGRYLDLLRQREMESQNLIRKGKVYINPGEKPPAGKQIKQGPNGGFYYETEGNQISYHHPFKNKELHYSDPAGHEAVERAIGESHSEDEGTKADALHRLYTWSDESRKDDNEKVQRERESDERARQKIEEKKQKGEYSHDKILPKAIQTFKKMLVENYLDYDDHSPDRTRRTIFSSQDDAKATAKKIITEIKPHSGDETKFKSFVDSKIKDKSLSKQEMTGYKWLKVWYNHRLESANLPQWKD